MTCPHCRHDARCKGFRPRTVVSLLGPLRLARHYTGVPRDFPKIDKG
jgi:hypothetical protein